MNLKKLTSWLLALVMIVSLMPMAAFAEEITDDSNIGVQNDITYDIRVSDTSDGDYTSIGNGPLTIKLGEKKYVKIYDGTNPLTDHTAVTITGNKDDIVTINKAVGYIEFTTNNSNTDYYSVTATIDDNSVSFNISVEGTSQGSNEGSSGESSTPNLTEVKMFFSADGGSVWNEYDYKNQPTKGIEIDATKTSGTYRIKFGYAEDNSIYLNGSPVHNMESDVVGFGYTGFESDDGNPDWNKPIGFMVNAKGINGSGYYTFKNDDINFGCQIKFTVTGNPENPYTNAKIVSANIGASAVTVATSLTGELTNAAEGFVLYADGTLTFTNTANAGSFDATVGGQLYTVVIFPNVNTMTDLTEDLTIKVDTADTAINSYLLNSSFATNEYNFITFVNGTATDVTGMQDGVFGKNADGAYTPIYVYKTSNGSLIDFDNNYYIQAVNAYMGKTSYLIKTEIVDIGGTDILKVYPLTSYADTTVKKNTMVLGQLTIAKNDGTVINQTVKTTDEETELKGTNGFEGGVLWTQVGEGLANANDGTFYIKNGSTLTLLDIVDISTLKVQSTNSDNVKLTEFFAKKGEENAIGFRIEMSGYDSFMSELVKVSFKNKKTGADECFYIPVICRDKEEALSVTVTPDQASSLQALYDTFPGTELYLEEGEYATDLYMWRGNLTLKGLGSGAVFTGSTDTTKPILTFGYEGYSNKNSDMSDFNNFRMFTNIAIDGKNKTKIGLKVEDGVALNLMKSAPTNGIGLDYINNCDTAILSTNEANSSTVNVYGLTFKNNNVAIQVTHGLGYAVVGNYTKEILENNFIGNTTDFKVTEENVTISVPQNFYADATGTVKPNGAPTVVGTTSFDYMPYYTTADRDTVRAQISPVATVADEATELEFPVSLRKTDLAVKLDKTLFEQMYAVKDTATYKVSVPVTEKGDKVNVIWNFDSAKLSATQPDATTLKVTNTLSPEAQAIVDTIDTAQTTVAQAVNFSHSGNLPGETTVYVLKEGTTTLENLKLYYINTTSGELELVDLNDAKVEEVTADNVVYYAVTIDHCSEYIISTAVVLEETNDNTGDGNNTDSTTGSSTGSTSSSSSSSSSSSTATPAPTTPATKTPTASITTPSANTFISAVEAETKFENATGSTVTFDVSEKTLVSSKIFEILLDNPDKALVLAADGYSWTFEANDITNAAATKDGFDTSISFVSENAQAIAELMGDAEIVNVVFGYKGELPGKATITIELGTEHANATRYLYKYDETTNTVELVGSFTTDDKGNISFTIDNCEEKALADLLLDGQQEPQTEQTTQSEENSETSTQPAESEGTDSKLPLIAIIAVVVIAGTIFFVIKRKKDEDEE